jgi:hypothetical protein
MAKSRRLPALFLLVAADPLPAAAQPPPTPDPPTIVTADEAIALDRARMRDFVAIDCPPGREGEEVIVCGRRAGFPRYRVPMADPDIGPRGRNRAAAAQLEAMAANDQSCSPVGRDNGCGGGLDVIGIGFAILRGIAQALANRD